MRSGIKILKDEPGAGHPVQRLRTYRLRLRLWLNRGDPVRWPSDYSSIGGAEFDDDGTTLTTDMRLDRQSLMNGAVYGMAGMRIGGSRTLRISPHLAYASTGVPGMIPADAVLTVEATVIGERLV
jgi:hypothetical protein